MDHALKPSTVTTYASAQRRYIRFCREFDLPPLPATEDTLVYFASHLYNSGLKGSSIHVYLSAVRNYHIINSYCYPTQCDRLSLVLRGATTLSALPCRKEPITFPLLEQLCRQASSRHDHLLLRTMMTLAFFGCLRAGEYTIPDSAPFDSAIHPCVGNILFDSDDRSFKYHVKRSKTDTFSWGVDIYIGCSGHSICAYCAMLKYFGSRGELPPTSPLFVDNNGSIIRRSLFSDAVRLLLLGVGKKPDLYSLHSFRSGAATSAAANNFESHDLKSLGRWKSEVYGIYLRDPKLATKFAARLVNTES